MCKKKVNKLSLMDKVYLCFIFFFIAFLIFAPEEQVDKKVVASQIVSEDSYLSFYEGIADCIFGDPSIEKKPSKREANSNPDNEANSDNYDIDWIVDILKDSQDTEKWNKTYIPPLKGAFSFNESRNLLFVLESGFGLYKPRRYE